MGVTSQLPFSQLNYVRLQGVSNKGYDAKATGEVVDDWESKTNQPFAATESSSVIGQSNIFLKDGITNAKECEIETMASTSHKGRESSLKVQDEILGSSHQPLARSEQPCRPTNSTGVLQNRSGSCGDKQSMIGESASWIESQTCTSPNHVIHNGSTSNIHLVRSHSGESLPSHTGGDLLTEQQVEKISLERSSTNISNRGIHGNRKHPIEDFRPRDGARIITSASPTLQIPGRKSSISCKTSAQHVSCMKQNPSIVEAHIKPLDVAPKSPVSGTNEDTVSEYGYCTNNETTTKEKNLETPEVVYAAAGLNEIMTDTGVNCDAATKVSSQQVAVYALIV